MLTHSLMQLTEYLVSLLLARLWGYSGKWETQVLPWVVVKGRSRETSYKPFAIAQERDNDSLYEVLK